MAEQACRNDFPWRYTERWRLRCLVRWRSQRSVPAARAIDPGGSAAAELERVTGEAWVVDADRQTGAIRFATPKSRVFTLPIALSLADALLAFLYQHKALFRMHDPMVDLVAENSDALADGSAHARFRQQEGGVPVYCATWPAHFDSVGRHVHGRRLHRQCVPRVDDTENDP